MNSDYVIFAGKRLELPTYRPPVERVTLKGGTNRTWAGWPKKSKKS